MRRSGRLVKTAVCLGLFFVANAEFRSISAQTLPECDGIAEVQTESLETVLLTVLEGARPLFVTSPPGDRERLFIVDQNGRIFLWKRSAAGEPATVFLDIRSRVSLASNEMGLLGLAFPPDFDATGHFYVNYTTVLPPLSSIVSRFSVSTANPDLADASSEARVFRVTQPDTNHNCGQLFFGPDRFLYSCFGDGGSAGDPWGQCGNGQNEDVLLGKLLRLDVLGIDPASRDPQCSSGESNYRVPSDNPFVDVSGVCPEILITGVRNPWRSAIDPATGDMYVADVGQVCWEEINFLPSSQIAGSNLGWRQMEGAHCYVNGSGSCDPAGVSCGDEPACFDASLTLPIFEYTHSEGCSITGGYVYRGCRLPKLRGAYFYGDYCSGWVESIRVQNGEIVERRDWTDEIFEDGLLPLNSLTSFGLDDRGELHIVVRTGEILKIVPAFAAIEVSGPGAAQPFRITRDSFSWEDVRASELRDIENYRVYRGLPGGTFECIWQGKETTFPGDPAVPEPGGLQAYLVTAVDTRGIETSAGGPPSGRTLSPLPCP